MGCIAFHTQRRGSLAAWKVVFFQAKPIQSHFRYNGEKRSHPDLVKLTIRCASIEMESSLEAMIQILKYSNENLLWFFFCLPGTNEWGHMPLLHLVFLQHLRSDFGVLLFNLQNRCLILINDRILATSPYLPTSFPMCPTNGTHLCSAWFPAKGQEHFI